MVTPTRSLVAVSAGLGQPSSTRLLTDRLVAATERHLRDAGIEAATEVIELREHAPDLANNLLTGFPSPALQAAIDSVTDADGLIVASPIFNASYSGLFKMFFDVIEHDSLDGRPVLLAATGGTARHSLALEHALRPLFSYLGADTVRTGGLRGLGRLGPGRRAGRRHAGPAHRPGGARTLPGDGCARADSETGPVRRTGSIRADAARRREPAAERLTGVCPEPFSEEDQIRALVRHAMRFPISVARVHGDVVDVAFVREQTDLAQAVAGRLNLGMVAAGGGRSRGPASVGRRRRSRPTGGRPAARARARRPAHVKLEHPDLVLAHRIRVVDEHGQRRATDQRFVVPIGGSDELGDRRDIGVSGPPQRWRVFGFGHGVRWYGLRCRSS